MTAHAVIYCKGIAAGKLVATHITVYINWFPNFILGKGPTMTCSKGSPTAGMGAEGLEGLLPCYMF